MAELVNLVDSSQTGQRLPSAWRNVISNWAGFVCSCLVSFFLSPFVVHRLGNSAYGIWMLVGSLTGYLGLLNLGVRTGVTRYVARFHMQKNDREASSVASTALAIFVAAGTIAIAVSVTLAALVVRVFHIPQSYQFATRVIVILTGCNVAVSLIGGVFGGILTALHRFDLTNLIEVGNSALSALAIFLVLSSGNGLIGLSLVNLAFATAVVFIYVRVVRHTYPSLNFSPFDCDSGHLKMICSISAFSFLMQISFNLIFYTDSIVIGRFLSVGLISFFAIAGNLMNYARTLISGISTTMTPRASALEVMGSQEALRTLLIKGTRLASVVMLPIAFTFLERGSSFIRLWIGKEYGDTSGHILWILALALIVVAPDQVAIAIMGGIDKYKLVVLVACFEALSNVTLSIVLARRMGIFGVAWGTTLPSLAVGLLFWPWYVRRALGIPMQDYLMSTWLRPIISMIPFALLTQATERLWPASNVFVFFLQVGAILPIAALFSWFFCCEDSDRNAYSEKFVQPVLRTFGWSLRKESRLF